MGVDKNGISRFSYDNPEHIHLFLEIICLLVHYNML